MKGREENVNGSAQRVPSRMSGGRYIAEMLVEERFKHCPSNRPEPDMELVRKVDFSRLAETFGCLGMRVERPEALRPALLEAPPADRPVVRDVATEPDHKPQDAWLPA